MKNSQKGFVVPLLIIIAIVVIGGAVYIYSKNGQFSKNFGGSLVSSGLKEINPQSIKQSAPEYFKYQGAVYYSSQQLGSRGAPFVVHRSLLVISNELNYIKY